MKRTTLSASSPRAAGVSFIKSPGAWSDDAEMPSVGAVPTRQLHHEVAYAVYVHRRAEHRCGRSSEQLGSTCSRHATAVLLAGHLAIRSSFLAAGLLGGPYVWPDTSRYSI